MRHALPPSLRRALVTSLLFGAASLPATSFADSKLLGPEDFADCLDGHAPTTQNVPVGPMDTKPDFDEIILDFDDRLSDGEIKTLAAQFGLKLKLNSEAADAPNIYIARVAEGAVPYA
jgi:hypothetical protein